MVTISTTNEFSRARFDTPSNCDTTEYSKYVILEFVLKSMPAFLFFVFGGLRYRKIKDYGRG